MEGSADDHLCGEPNDLITGIMLAVCFASIKWYTEGS